MKYARSVLYTCMYNRILTKVIIVCDYYSVSKHRDIDMYIFNVIVTCIVIIDESVKSKKNMVVCMLRYCMLKFSSFILSFILKNCYKCNYKCKYVLLIIHLLVDIISLQVI